MLPMLGYWFGHDPEAAIARAKQWLQQHPQMGKDLAWARPQVEEALRGGLDSLAARPEGRVALILTLDAVPRLLWRGEERAYAGDMAAQGHLMQAIARKQIAQMDPMQQLYAFLPFMHSEELEHQKRSVQEYQRIVGLTQGPEQEAARDFFLQARQHHDIIREFGRFPDRNAALHRYPRPGEAAFLRRQDHLWFAPQTIMAV